MGSVLHTATDHSFSNLFVKNLKILETCNLRFTFDRKILS